MAPRRVQGTGGVKKAPVRTLGTSNVAKDDTVDTTTTGGPDHQRGEQTVGKGEVARL